MLEELNDLIKTDTESQASFGRFKTKKEELEKYALKRARTTALVLGGATVISLLFLLFAFVTKTKAEKERIKFESQINTLEKKLEDCSIK